MARKRTARRRNPTPSASGSLSLGRREGETTRRVYVHETCGGFTEVTDEHLVGVCDPGTEVEQTYCSVCGDFDALDTFAWRETGETLENVRARMRELVPAWQRRVDCLLGIGLLVVPTAGAVIGGLLTSDWTWRVAYALGGLALGFTLMIALLGTYEDWLPGAVNCRREL